MRDLITTAEVAITAIDSMIEILTDARQHFKDWNDLTAWGTLTLLDSPAEELRAAITLYKALNRRREV